MQARSDLRNEGRSTAGTAGYRRDRPQQVSLRDSFFTRVETGSWVTNEPRRSQLLRFPRVSRTWRPNNL